MAADEESPLIAKDQDGVSKKPRQISLLLPCLIGVFLANADSSLLLVTQDEIASAFHSVSSAPLLLIAYSLGFSVALPVFGALSDIYGCRRFLLAAYAFFAVGCLISGIAATPWQFIGARVLAGVGGAGMTDLVSVLVTEIFDITEVAPVRAYVLSAGILGSSCGGPFGGYLTDTVGWRWSLAGQTPIALICLALAAWLLPPTEVKASSDDSKQLPKLWDIDFLGVASFFVSVSSFILLLEQNRIDASTVYYVAAFTVFGVAFIFIETVWAKHPIIPPALFFNSSVGWIFLGQILLHCEFFTILVNLGPYYVRAESLSNTDIAFRIWPGSLGFVVGSLIAGRIINKTTRYQRLAVIGMLVIVGFQGLMAVRYMDGIQGWEVLYIFPWSVGAGLLFSAQFIAMVVCAPKDQVASATGVYYFSQQLGVIIGTGLSTSMLRWAFTDQLSGHFDQQLIEKIIDDVNFVATLPAAVQQIIRSSYIHAFRTIPWSAFGFAAVALPIILFHRERDMRAAK